MAKQADEKEASLKKEHQKTVQKMEEVRKRSPLDFPTAKTKLLF